MNLRIKTKNRATDPELEFLTKSIWKQFGCAAAMPKALELSLLNNYVLIKNSTYSHFVGQYNTDISCRMSNKSFDLNISFFWCYNSQIVTPNHDRETFKGQIFQFIAAFFACQHRIFWCHCSSTNMSIQFWNDSK